MKEQKSTNKTKCQGCIANYKDKGICIIGEVNCLRPDEPQAVPA